MTFSFPFDTKTVSREHPYIYYPRIFRIFFNNFMLIKSKHHSENAIDWQYDIKLYSFDRKMVGVEIPSFTMAENIYKEYGSVDE